MARDRHATGIHTAPWRARRHSPSCHTSPHQIFLIRRRGATSSVYCCAAAVIEAHSGVACFLLFLLTHPLSHHPPTQLNRTHTRPIFVVSFAVSKIQMAAVSRNLVVVALLAATGLVQAGERNHKYAEGDEVTLWVNKVGPYHNPHETYEYYDLPFCKPVGGVETRRRSNSLGSSWRGTSS